MLYLAVKTCKDSGIDTSDLFSKDVLKNLKTHEFLNSTYCLV